MDKLTANSPTLASRLLQPGNLITLSGLLAILALAYCKYQSLTPWPVNLLLLVYGYRIADELDGRVARRLGQNSIFGELLDLLIDRANDCILSAIVILARPDMFWFVVAFFVLKIAPEHLLGRLLGISDHKNAMNTQFSRIYTLFHNFYVLQCYLLVKTLFFISGTGTVVIPYFEWVFLAFVAFRSLYVLEALQHISNVANNTRV